MIDTLFNIDVYFSKWGEYHQLLPDEIVEPKDYHHGTEVTSIIVDGPALNRKLDDGCGHFKVGHFGVSKGERTSFLEIIRKIDQIVKNEQGHQGMESLIRSEPPD